MAIELTIDELVGLYDLAYYGMLTLDEIDASIADMITNNTFTDDRKNKDEECICAKTIRRKRQPAISREDEFIDSKSPTPKHLPERGQVNRVDDLKVKKPEELKIKPKQQIKTNDIKAKTLPQIIHREDIKPIAITEIKPGDIKPKYTQFRSNDKTETKLAEIKMTDYINQYTTKTIELDKINTVEDLKAFLTDGESKIQKIKIGDSTVKNDDASLQSIMKEIFKRKEKLVSTKRCREPFQKFTTKKKLEKLK